MLKHSAQRAAGRWRRLVFGAWIGLTVALALYLAVVHGVLGYGRQGVLWSGAPVPFVMILLMLLGLGWLVWLVTARRRPPTVGSSGDRPPVDG